MNSQLNKMNLVGGEEPIGQPDDHGHRAEMPRGQVISSRGSGAQRDGARQLGVHARFPAELFQDRLKKKSYRRGRAQQQESISVRPENEDCQGRRQRRHKYK